MLQLLVGLIYLSIAHIWMYIAIFVLPGAALHTGPLLGFILGIAAAFVAFLGVDKLEKIQ